MKINVSDFFHSNTALSKEFHVLLFIFKIVVILSWHQKLRKQT